MEAKGFAKPTPLCETDDTIPLDFTISILFFFFIFFF